MNKNNKVIAEFMGLKESIIFSETFGNPMYVVNGKITNLRYDFSWDWLMPVLQKLDKEVFVSIPEDLWYLVRNTTYGLLNYNIDQTYKAIIEVIKWYNQNK